MRLVPRPALRPLLAPLVTDAVKSSPLAAFSKYRKLVLAVVEPDKLSNVRAANATARDDSRNALGSNSRFLRESMTEPSYDRCGTAKPASAVARPVICMS